MMNDTKETPCDRPGAYFVVHIKKTDGPPIFMFQSITFFKNKRNQGIALRKGKRTGLVRGIEDLDKICAVFCQQDSCVEIKFLLLYRKHHTNVNNFIQNLRNILNKVSVDVVLGDFNVNYFSDKDSAELKSASEESLDFQQVVKKPTFISGSLLGHVYVKMLLLRS